MNNQCALIAIAKNEGRYIREWVLYHLSIGMDRIIVYDNESTDDTPAILNDLAQKYPVTRIVWPSVQRKSPQRSAYNDAVGLVKHCEWGLFIDIDEFIVPWGHVDFPAFISTIPSTVGAVAINWQTFGSSGVTSSDYASVIKTFTRCGGPTWMHNLHFKTLARLSMIQEMKIHEVVLKDGDKVNSRLEPLVLSAEGRSDSVTHAGIQLNHYQSKTFEEFNQRMSRGNANFPPGHPNHVRDDSINRFKMLDRNDCEDDRILRFMPGLERFLALTERPSPAALQVQPGVGHSCTQESSHNACTQASCNMGQHSPSEACTPSGP